MTNELAALIEGFAAQRVLVIGDVMLDEYVWGEVSRISPEAPVPVVNVLRRTYRPGGAGNVAASVAALGGAPTLIGVAGADPMAAALRQALAEVGVDRPELIAVPERPTTVKTRILAQSQQMLRCDVEVTDPLGAAAEDALLALVRDRLAAATVCVISDYAKGVLTRRVCQSVIQAAAQAGVPVIVDPKGVSYERYAGATVITPNLNEAATATGLAIHGPEQLGQAAGALMARLGGSAVIITRGAEGMTLFQPGAEPLTVPARARAVYDVTGAGDTVVAALAVALGGRAGLPDAMQLATVAAGIVVGKLGTATVSQAELLAVLLP
ncbi:MAG TPA: D-glycero-beta-D-manno-heptose-7-phosphate kinase [Herpetosiphonaceae bacterium]|nr:D-glycero-beta-D-manno-heptose-7-phosphate kinase [Herpetosiphonaceae bacterium]